MMTLCSLSLILFPRCVFCVFTIQRYIFIFQIGTCHIGWAYYSAIGGTFLAFLCAYFANHAESSVGSDRVEYDINKGKNPVCAL